MQGTMSLKKSWNLCLLFRKILCIVEYFATVKRMYHMIRINQPTRCNSFPSLLLDVYVWLNMFQALPRPSSGAYNYIASLCFYRWGVAVAALLVVVCQTTTNNSSVVGRGLPDHDQQRCYRHAPTVKPEAANVVVSS